MRRCLIVPFVALCALTACSNSKTVSSDRTTDASAPTSEAPPATSDATTTTSAVAATTSTTSSTSTSTTVAPAAPLVLRGNGIGSYTVGDVGGEVVTGLTDQLGSPATDITVEYPVAEGLGQYQTANGESGFIAPLGRSVCWANGFCAEFGGATLASAAFTGWSYRDDTTGSLRSTSGATIGTRWSDLPAITADEGGCYSVGSGQIDGIRLTLESSGDPFGSFDASGNYVTNLPDPADVTVIWMEAGEVPIFLYGDC